MSNSSGKRALILTGGGARAAYQVGVLKAVRELLPDPRRNPFPILCGTSAGAINAASIAVNATDFAAGVDRLVDIWQNFHAGQVYRADPLGIAVSGAKWLTALAIGWITHRAPRSLLDNEPLRRLLEQMLDFARIDQAIDAGALHSISITCSGYATGQSVSFFQGRADLEPWRRAQRLGAHVKLRVDHLMASAAIPFVFPSVRINREWFGDGSMRQMAPISPAIHLGADRILVVGAGRHAAESQRPAEELYPSLAQVAGHALSSIFLDSLSADLESAARVNRMIAMMPPEIRQTRAAGLRPIDVLVIAPSERLDVLAAAHAGALPRSVRALLRGIGAMNRSGGALTSYLLFEKDYTQKLIELGYGDTMARAGEVRDFLDV
jgi:NTE family protein